LAYDPDLNMLKNDLRHGMVLGSMISLKGDVNVKEAALGVNKVKNKKTINFCFDYGINMGLTYQPATYFAGDAS
jgi:hypothetical protein